MCGIIGTLGAEAAIVEKGLGFLQERGPDETTSAHFPFAGIGITRLAITDIQAGSQPLCSLSGQTAVAYNGEIYNHREIREEFPGAFRSWSDGEVIHALYERHGLRFADYLEGMYSVILIDLKRRRMVLANDPIGIKPLYWARRGDALVAASSIRAFPDDMKSRVRRFPAGQVWASDGAEALVQPRFKPRLGLLGELRRSVYSHLPDEVAWGCMLSGGLDSALITALACERSRKPVIAYTVGTPGSPDLEAACKLAADLRLDHRIVAVDRDELLEIVERVIEVTASCDRFVIPGGVGTFLIARQAARDGLKVLLSGEGADELFAGYDCYLNVLPQLLNQSLQEDLHDLGSTECLRLDRCAMAHGVEVRVPFLAPRVVRMAGDIPIQEKIIRRGRRAIKKHCLRQAASSVLPLWAAQREKAPFLRGSGLEEAVHSLALKQVGEEPLRSLWRNQNGFRFDKPMDVLIFAIWKRKYPTLAGSWDEMVERGLARKAANGRT